VSDDKNKRIADLEAQVAYLERMLDSEQRRHDDMIREQHERMSLMLEGKQRMIDGMIGRLANLYHTHPHTIIVSQPAC
jgi:hypothetical protein